MGKLAIIFPGQGSQTVGMLSGFYNEKIVIDVFNEASATLGYDVFELISNGPKETLNLTEYTQPLILTCSYALWKLFKQKIKLRPDVLAGHSLGEYSALVCADSISFKEALLLVKFRGQVMQKSTKGIMAAIIGLDKTKVDEICTYSSSDNNLVQAVNYNSELQTVIAGNNEAVETAMIKAKENGAKLVQKLPVSVPSHCLLMKEASFEFAKKLEKVNFKMPQIPVIHNFNSTSANNLDELKLALTKQLYSPVLWLDTIKSILNDYNVESIYECGPGKVLTGLNKRITDKSNLSHIDNPAFFEKIEEGVTNAVS